MTDFDELSHAGQSPAQLGALLLALFAPATHRSVDPERSVEHRTMWRREAIHRAKNLSQMAASLVEVGSRPERGWLTTEIASHMRAVARLYEELGEDGDGGAVPCADMLVDVVSRLTQVFGSARNIRCTVDADPCNMLPDERRALVLIASELVINAIKHGFGDQDGGHIRVRFERMLGVSRLVVEDDGSGMRSHPGTSQGTGLMDQMAVILRAQIARLPSTDGKGLRVVTFIPKEEQARMYAATRA